MSAEQKGNLHGGHRKRMLERARRFGFEAYNDHQLLEQLLFYVNRRMDTNPIAHALLVEFGSLSGVLDADVDALCRVRGVGERTAILFRLICEMMRRYEDRTPTQANCFLHLGEVAQFFYARFLGVGTERLYALLLNGQMGLLELVQISEGDRNGTEASIRAITRHVVRTGASAVILAHPHPSGLSLPSAEDLRFTDLLNGYLGTLNVILVEHLIFAGTRYEPIMRRTNGGGRTSPLTQKIDNGFYEQFYDREASDYHVESALRKTEFSSKVL